MGSRLRRFFIPYQPAPPPQSPPSQSSPIEGEEVKRGRRWDPAFAGARGERVRGDGGGPPGPARFFVAGPSQNDIRGRGLLRMTDWSPPTNDVGAEEGNHKGLPLRGDVVGIGECPHLNPLPGWGPLHNLSISPTAAPITLTLILSQDGRGDKIGGDCGYAKVSRMGEEVRREGMGSRLRGSKRGGGDHPGPARFFVAGPPQNDMLVLGEEVRRGGCCGRDDSFFVFRFFLGEETKGFSCVIRDSLFVVVENEWGL